MYYVGELRRMFASPDRAGQMAQASRLGILVRGPIACDRLASRILATKCGVAFYGTELDFEQDIQIERTMNETTDASIIPIWRAIGR